MNHVSLTALASKARQYLLAMIYHAGSGHPGGSLSAVDLLCYLYFVEMKTRANAPHGHERDRFILSKGHACPALYAVGHLAGLLARSDLASFRKISGLLQGHPFLGSTPWVETSTGSLGQGVSVAVGAALGLRHQNIPAATYVMLGDGELQEGEVWEAAMFAAHHRLNQLCAIIDFNKMQSDDLNRNIINLEPLADKWQAFGWSVHELDGHNFSEMERAFQAFEAEKNLPTVLIAHTLKGKGISYMEGVATWHGSVKLSSEDLGTALADLGVDDCEIQACLDGSIWGSDEYG